MRILFLVESLALGGGAEKFAVNLGDQLHNKGHQIFYLTFQDKGPKYEFKGEYYTLNQYYNYTGTGKIDTLQKIADFFKNSLKIKKICREKGIDALISVAGVQNYHAIFSSILGNRTKIIVTQHSAPQIFSKREKNAMKILYPLSHKIVCDSGAMEDTFKKMGIKNNILTLYNTLDIQRCLELGEGKISDEFHKYNSPFVFIYVGRLNWSKGHWYLLRSFKKVVKRYDKVKLFIRGDGDLKEEIEDFIKKLGLQSNAFILEKQENIFLILKNSNCFVFPSLFEGLPLSLIEALSANLPVISTDCQTGPREILCPELQLDEKIEYPYFGKYGILIEPFMDADEILVNTPELVFKTLDETPLSREEEIFADLMIRMVEDGRLREKYADGLERAWDFNNNENIKVWESIIQK